MLIETHSYWNIETLKNLVSKNTSITLSDESKVLIQRNHDYLTEKISEENAIFYGINTGFGSLCQTIIPNNELEKLQENLLLSHACGMGNLVCDDIVRLMLALKIKSLSQGFSGVQLETVEMLIWFYNNNILPLVYEQGSLGASGDLAPLAHLCLPLIGKGKIKVKNEILETEDFYLKNNIKPIKLKAKEGLALINGTQFMSSYMANCILNSKKLIHQSNLIAALSIEAFDARIEPFLKYSHEIRPHKGQLWVAGQIENLLKGSQIISQEKKQVQDPYSFRCIPQVHGATYEVIETVAKVLEVEINSVTDNPNVFDKEDLILSAGNFHGQILALHLDFLAIGMSELANISERRVYKLISGERSLPAFLTQKSGLNSGLMIAQYTAASIVSQNKQLCTPASVDSIVSSNGQEDHVSMGANAATKCKLVVENVQKVYAIEMLCANRAIEFRKPLKSSEKIEDFISKISEKIKLNDEDEYLKPKMDEAYLILKEFI